MSDHPAYLAGKRAFREGKSFARNPYTAVVSTTTSGTIVYRDQHLRTLWAMGFQAERSEQKFHSEDRRRCYTTEAINRKRKSKGNKDESPRVDR